MVDLGGGCEWGKGSKTLKKGSLCVNRFLKACHLKSKLGKKFQETLANFLRCIKGGFEII
jgi:hypothetical protein